MSSILARLVLLCAGSLLLFANVAQCQQDWTQAQRTCVNQCMTSGAACSAANCGFIEVCPANLGSMMTRRCYGCFYPTMPGFTFDQSQARCQQLNGANLVSVHSQAEYTILRNLITSTPNPDGKHHSFWLGMRLARNAQGTVSGAAWNDGTPLDFGNPVSGRGQSPWAVGEPVNAGNCVRMMGWGPFQNLWYDADCNQATNLVPTIGYFCKGCPTGWSMFNGRCYKAIVFPNNQDFTFAQLQNMCTAFNSRMVSIHSQAENNFVFNLVTASFPTVPSIALGIQINRAANGALQSLQWVDGSPVDFGATTTGGVAPWATTITGFPAQPDNRPAQQTTGCTMMWIDEAVPATKQPGRWDDVTCTNNRQRGTVCKF